MIPIEDLAEQLRSEVEEANKNPNDRGRLARESREKRLSIASFIPVLRSDPCVAAFALYQQIKFKDEGPVREVIKQKLFELRENIDEFIELESSKEDDEKDAARL